MSTSLLMDYETEVERDQKYRATRAWMLKNLPSESELPFWLLHVLDLWLPHRQVCDGHTTPLAYFSDRYYEREWDTVLWAARFWGKSLNSGLECWMKGRDSRRPYWQANICAGSAAQAAKAYEAADLFWTKTGDIGGRVVLKRDPLKSVTEFLDGSKYEITTASPKAQRGPHPNALYADEIDEMARDVFNAALNQTMERYGHKPTTALLSTMHKVGGLMSEWVDNADVRGFKLYISCVLETLEACTGDYNCETCNLDPYCQRKLKTICQEEEDWQLEQRIIKPGQKPYIGFNTIETIQQKVRQGYEREESTGRVKLLDIDAELFCRRPSRTGLVFPDFNKNFHVVPAQEIHIQTEWKKFRTTDFGFSNPFVDLYAAITPRDQIIFYYELVKTAMTMPDIIEHLREGRKHTMFLKTFADPAGTTEIETIRRAGIPMVGVVSEIQEGVKAITHLLRQNVEGRPQFIVSSACPILINELEKLSYPESGLSEKPVKKDDHCVEAARRGVVAWIRGSIQSLSSLLEGIKIVKDRHKTGTDEVYQQEKQSALKVHKSKGGRKERPRGVSDYL